MKRLTKARERGLYPIPEPMTYHNQSRVEITVSVNEDVYDFLAANIQPTNTFWSIETIVNEALDTIVGKKVGINHMVDIAQLRRSRPETIMFGKISGAAERKAMMDLFEACWALAVHLTSEDKGDSKLPIRNLLAMLSLAMHDQRELAAELARTPVYDNEDLKLLEMGQKVAPRWFWCEKANKTFPS
ncbi:hypothetical protein [Seohaeicola zhoushanensis]|uniref:Uncharacterized protein n=1 Tax=Seohaeicola zhoushanensis TaxID=1569283 RepID=A0A8J3H278_9RHOB|nr:hypothetical protein [Seohaeicola zhoushanensis]GHF70121.1 hypothetical protein GCM10017056_46460 [Seohaeicola zhoushanensis]